MLATKIILGIAFFLLAIAAINFISKIVKRRRQHKEDLATYGTSQE